MYKRKHRLTEWQEPTVVDQLTTAEVPKCPDDDLKKQFTAFCLLED